MKSAMACEVYDVEKLWGPTTNFLIRCELFFRLVKHDGFVKYVTSLESEFTLLFQIILRRGYVMWYHEKKTTLKKLLSGQSNFLIFDTWTSMQNMNYMFITTYFID